ncbi:DNA repair protein RecO [Candidatus Parcubacteria bacterium]|nr:DNA repair protein RecO [Candidatus Parcubacteria bacterium]
MAYPIYTTPGFVLSSYKIGEADRLLQIFTRDLGVVFAKATGIRKLKSKLRGHVQDYNLGLFSMVHGKSGWKLTNGDVYESGEYRSFSLRQKEVLARVASLLRRLYVGEEPNEKLFETIISFFSHEMFLKEDKIGVFELVVGVNILSQLGYVGDESITSNVVQMGHEIDSDFVLENKKKIILEINSALSDSQL